MAPNEIVKNYHYNYLFIWLCNVLTGILVNTLTIYHSSLVYEQKRHVKISVTKLSEDDVELCEVADCAHNKWGGWE